jgi:hypothetical protein
MILGRLAASNCLAKFVSTSPGSHSPSSPSSPSSLSPSSPSSRLPFPRVPASVFHSMAPCLTHRLRFVVFSLLLFLSIWPTAGCLGDRCGPGQILQEGACVRIPSDALADGQPDSAAQDLDTSGLGTPCSASTDCPGKADFCVVMPGKTSGYCTYRDCSIEANDCPAPYTCLDLAKYMPNLPTACIKI